MKFMLSIYIVSLHGNAFSLYISNIIIYVYSGCMLTGKLPNPLMRVVMVLLSRLARYLWTADSQFGFKQGYGTEMAIFALKQTVYFYRNQDTPVYMCFLDAK